MRVVGEHAIKHWFSIRKEVHHGLEEGDAHNAEEAIQLLPDATFAYRLK